MREQAGSRCTAESGLGGVEASAFGAIRLVAATPQPLVLQLNQHLVSAINTPEFKEQTAANGSEVGGDSPEKFAAFLRAESAKWGKLIKNMKTWRQGRDRGDAP